MKNWLTRKTRLGLVLVLGVMLAGAAQAGYRIQVSAPGVTPPPPSQLVFNPWAEMYDGSLSCHLGSPENPDGTLWDGAGLDAMLGSIPQWNCWPRDVTSTSGYAAADSVEGTPVRLAGTFKYWANTGGCSSGGVSVNLSPNKPYRITLKIQGYASGYRANAGPGYIRYYDPRQGTYVSISETDVRNQMTLRSDGREAVVHLTIGPIEVRPGESLMLSPVVRTETCSSTTKAFRNWGMEEVILEPIE